MSKTPDNIHEFSVSELSFALKRMIEENYPYVRLRGELGRVSRPASGHIYLDLKDEKAVINGVIWKGVAARLAVQPEQGLEVIATGKLTTFPGQSRYQIIIERMEPAGAGALMALLEARKKKLAAEGLFDPERKRQIPFLPKIIGVVTSPSGAVIRDILHRLADRFATRVVVWPVRVQGESCGAEVAAAIEGFNALEEGGDIPRPDLIIVARGGGSLEDLWGFNEEAVVRAAAQSTIPLISAVGHETDWTLIDFAADERAPTPTAAAERAVPVRADLVFTINDLERRLALSLNRIGRDSRNALKSAARAMPDAADLLMLPRQRLDAAALGILHALRTGLARHRSRFERQAGRVSLTPIIRQLEAHGARIEELGERMKLGLGRVHIEHGQRLKAQAKLLASLGYKNVLARGFALVRDEDGVMLRSAKAVVNGAVLEIEFSDGRKKAVAGGAAGPRPKKNKSTPPDIQGRLL